MPYSRGIFPTPGSNPSLPHSRQILYHLSHQGSPRTLEWVAYPFSKGSSIPRNGTRISCIAGRFFDSWATREALPASTYFLFSSLNLSAFIFKLVLVQTWVLSYSLCSPLSNEQGASLVAQTVKNLPAMLDTLFWFLGWVDPLEKEMATHSSILDWRIPWSEEPGGQSPWGHKESNMTEWLTL